MKLSGSLLRVSLLLFVVSVVGLVGVNGSLDPSRIQTAKAAALDIVLSSDNQSSLQFQLNVSEACPPFLAPGTSCLAEVIVENVGDETAEISPPTSSVSGPLHTCDGGGPNIDVFFQNATYNNPVTLIDPGDTESFEVVFSLDLAMGNPCQGQTATITVTIQTGLPILDPTATPIPPTETPTPEVVIEEAPTSTPVPTFTPAPTATAIPAQPGLSVDTNFGGLISEIGGVRIDPNTGLPYRLPVTGQGWESERGLDTVTTLFVALGALSIAIFIVALLTRRKDARR